MLIHPVMYDYHINCDNCKKETLELYDRYNKSVGYNTIVRFQQFSLIDNKSLRYFRCNNCGKIYNIDWTGNFPVPFTEINMNDYIKRFQSIEK